MAVRVDWDAQLKLIAGAGSFAVHWCADATALARLAEFRAGPDSSCLKDRHQF